MEEKVSELLEFFKALADGNRLRIVGLLAQREYTVEHIAELLGLSASTVSHHLAKLRKSGLVSARSESYYNIYRLETKKLEEMSERLLAKETAPELILDVDLDAYDRKVLNIFCHPDGRIRTFPAQRKKFEVLLRYVVKDFELGEKYTEKQVNQILGWYFEDTAALRRGLIEYKMMARESGGGKYWLLGE